MNDISNKIFELDRKSLDKCSMQYLKLTYWKIVFKSKKSKNDENILKELQVLLHMRHLINAYSNKKKKFNNEEQYCCQILLSHYKKKLPVEYVQIKKEATQLICSFINARHTYSCNTCDRIILSLTDFRMFICEHEHKELRCPVTLGPLGLPCLVCSMCKTMANVKAGKF